MLRLKLVDVAAEAIIKMIQNNEYDQNGYLPSEGDMATKLDVSRSTIREAVRSLEVRGFVLRRHGKGVQVVDASVEVMTRSLSDMFIKETDILDDLLEMRMVLEPVGAQFAALSHTTGDVEALESYLRIMENPAVSDSEYFNADLEFHLAIAKASKNRIHQSFITAYTPILRQMIVESCETTARPELEFHFHRNIFEAIVACDPEEAREQMLSHLRGTNRYRKAESRL